MLKRKFKNGPYIYQGNQIDMYQLSRWIEKYNRENKTSLKPSNVTEKHIKLFLGFKMYTEAEWDAECQRNWMQAARQLKADGWVSLDDSYLPTFVKDGRQVYLAKELGTSRWRPSSWIFERSSGK